MSKKEYDRYLKIVAINNKNSCVFVSEIYFCGSATELYKINYQKFNGNTQNVIIITCLQGIL